MPADHDPPYAGRLRLRPGAPILRRDGSTLQVGLDAPARAVLPDSPEVRRLLTALTTGTWQPPRPGACPPSVAVAVGRLQEARLLVAVADRRARSRPGLLEATAAWSGPEAEGRLRARTDLDLLVVGSPERTEPLVRLLAECGLAARRSDRLEPPVAATEPGQGPGPLVVLVTPGEPHRGSVDVLVGSGLAHLLLWSRGGLPRVGPLVVPGATACLRCLDAHESQLDPRRALLLEQAARVDSVPPPDPALDGLAVAWAARDVARWAEGDEPSTFSAVVTLDAHCAPHPVHWTRHLHCGCAWDSDLYATG